MTRQFQVFIQEEKNTHPQKDLYAYVHIKLIIHSNQKLEPTDMVQRMDKPIVVYSYSRIEYSSGVKKKKKGKLLIHVIT